jgi:hypothetical protein
MASQDQCRYSAVVGDQRELGPGRGCHQVGGLDSQLFEEKAGRVQITPTGAVLGGAGHGCGNSSAAICA